MSDTNIDDIFKYFSNIDFKFQILFAFIFGVVISVKSSWGLLVLPTYDLSILLTKISGTLVAIAWPSAQMASRSVGRAKDLMKSVLDRDIDKSDIEKLEDEFEDLKEYLEPGRRGVYSSVMSFIFALLSIILPNKGFSYLGLEFIVESVLCGISVFCLLMAIINFVPTVLYSFRFIELNSAIKSLRVLAENSDSTGTSETNDFGEASSK